MVGPIQCRLGHTPLVELSDGGGGLPFLNATAPYDAGDWQPALRNFRVSGTYDAEIKEIDDLATTRVRRESRAHAREAAKARKAKARAHARKATSTPTSRVATPTARSSCPTPSTSCP